MTARMARTRPAEGTNAARAHGVRRSPLLLCVAMLVAAATIAAACGDEQAAAPSGDPSITGVVASARPVDDEKPAVGWFRIDEGTGDYDRASVTVDDDTDWYRPEGDGFVRIEPPRATELTGKSVEVRFTGVVAESYPVQARASWVIVED